METQIQTRQHSSGSLKKQNKLSDLGLTSKKHENLPEEVLDRWLELKNCGKFSIVAADQTLIDIKDQKKIGSSLEAVIENKNLLPSFGMEKKYLGDATLTMKLISILNPLNTLSVGKNSLANETGIKTLAELLAEDETLNGFKLIEIHLVVKGILRGDFGTLYDRMDSAVFFECLKKYDTQRSATLEEMSRKKRHEQSLDYKNINPELAGKMAEVFKKYKMPEKSDEDKEKEIDEKRKADIETVKLLKDVKVQTFDEYVESMREAYNGYKK